MSVQWIVDRLCDCWGQGAYSKPQPGDHPHEASFLKLDVSKARQRLGWQPRWSLESALANIVEWHQAWRGGANMRMVCLKQINEYGF